MTEDDLDLLASAYVDGEATSEEVALVEGDPELLARVAELRAVSEQLSAMPPVDAALKQQHLAAAMAEFSGLAASVDSASAGVAAADPASVEPTAGPNTTSSVPSLAEKRRDREARKAQRSMPQWMPAAAAFLLIGGGVVFLAGRGGDNDSSAEMATEALDTSSDEAADFMADDASDAVAAEPEARLESDMMEESMEDSADDSAFDADAAATEESADSLAGGAAGSEVVPDVDDDSEEASPATTAVASTTTSGGFFPQEPVMQYAAVPEVDGIFVDLPAPRGELESSLCGFELDGALVDLEITGYLPIEIAGAPAELFAVLTQDGSDSAIIVDESCEQLTAG